MQFTFNIKEKVLSWDQGGFEKKSWIMDTHTPPPYYSPLWNNKKKFLTPFQINQDAQNGNLAFFLKNIFLFLNKYVKHRSHMWNSFITKVKYQPFRGLEITNLEHLRVIFIIILPPSYERCTQVRRIFEFFIFSHWMFLSEVFLFVD